MSKALSRFYVPMYTITFILTNTGHYDGSKVSQLYLGFPEETAQPPKILRGFERVYWTTGESKTTTFTLNQKDISF